MTRHEKHMAAKRAIYLARRARDVGAARVWLAVARQWLYLAQDDAAHAEARRELVRP